VLSAEFHFYFHGIHFLFGRFHTFKKHSKFDLVTEFNKLNLRKENSYSILIKTGYELFAEEGHEGLQIERLSRITGLNKSGFYHYFGDSHEYLNHLIKEHDRNIEGLLEPFANVESYDPGFFNVMLQNKYICFFHIQLVRNRHLKIFIDAHERNNQRIDSLAIPVFSREVGLSQEAAMPYYEMLRDMFFTRVDIKSMDYEFLHSLFEQFKVMISMIISGSSKS
jgi:AcrR family transcriptional regulator